MIIIEKLNMKQSQTHPKSKSNIQKNDSRLIPDFIDKNKRLDLRQRK